MTTRLTDAELEALDALAGWPRPWRTDTSTGGDDSDVVGDNAAYPDEIAHLAEFADDRDATLSVKAVNALPDLIAEVRRWRAGVEQADAHAAGFREGTERAERAMREWRASPNDYDHGDDQNG